jgi:hypothetical protein
VVRRHIVWSAAAALVMGAEAVAGMSYNYVQGDLAFGQLQATGNSGSGIGNRFEGAMEIEQELFGYLGFGFQKFSMNGANHRFSTGSLGVGGHMPVSDTLDFVATVAAERVKRRVSGSGSDSYNGWGVSGGLRGQPRKGIEWTAGIRYRSLKSIQSTYGLTVGGRYFLTPAFALGLDISAQMYDKKTLDATETVAAITFRYDFGTRY